MASQAQIDANRRNAEKSTGPKTLHGKLIVSKNAVKHGLLSPSGLLLGEDAGAFQELYDSMFNEFEPESPFEVSLVEGIIWTIWRLRRVPRVEAGRYVWNRYAVSQEGVFGYNRQQYRARIAQAVAAEYASAPEAAGPPARDEEIKRLRDHIVEEGLHGYAWQTDNSDLPRYEGKLHRRLQNFLPS